MKIEGRGPVKPKQVYPVEETGPQSARGIGSRAQADEVRVSAEARLRQEMLSRLKGLPDVRSEVVRELGRKVAEGEYAVEPEKLAGTMLEEIARQRR
ncbi:MAG: flagellar biosynthesis anti-sigma factor FlgM [Clostridia bacterium]|nr:flagellar biosynthesis anti-sigma factor FlgM [Clostridia bacterium]MDH7572608.1 flagellar biosynthesis anti-sigma factor FlgM [Clostridia bacterium]